ncbi:MAG: nuclear transport factor 2 family protein [Actinomycetota bacterium]
MHPGLEILLDEHRIIQTLTRFGRGIHYHDTKLMRSALHPDAVARHGTFIGDPIQLTEFLNELHIGHTRGHQHFISNFTIAVDSDVALREAYANLILRRKDAARVDISGGRYIDRVERGDGAWKIGDRAVSLTGVRRRTKDRSRRARCATTRAECGITPILHIEHTLPEDGR